jgi:hypothetical protein
MDYTLSLLQVNACRLEKLEGNLPGFSVWRTCVLNLGIFLRHMLVRCSKNVVLAEVGVVGRNSEVAL